MIKNIWTEKSKIFGRKKNDISKFNILEIFIGENIW